MSSLDVKDRRIISQLDMHARMSVNSLARAVAARREMVTYRLERLTKRGVIAGAHAVFDVDVIGYRSFRLLLRLNTLTDKEKRSLVDYLTNHSHAWWVASIGGRWDVIVNFVAKDSSSFNDIFDELVSRYGEFLQDYLVLIYINIRDFSRSYILDKKLRSKKEREFFFHEMKFVPTASVDQTDYKLMSVVAEHARLSYTQIGEKIGLTRNAVKHRMKRLEDSGLILGYRLTYHPSKLGYSSYLLLLNINNLKKERELALLEYARSNPHIIFAVKHIGKYRITFECEVENEKAFHTLLGEVRGLFHDILIDFDFFPIFYDHKITYFPLSKLYLENKSKKKRN